MRTVLKVRSWYVVLIFILFIIRSNVSHPTVFDIRLLFVYYSWLLNQHRLWYDRTLHDVHWTWAQCRLIEGDRLMRLEHQHHYWCATVLLTLTVVNLIFDPLSREVPKTVGCTIISATDCHYGVRQSRWVRPKLGFHRWWIQDFGGKVCCLTFLLVIIIRCFSVSTKSNFTC